MHSNHRLLGNLVMLMFYCVSSILFFFCSVLELDKLEHLLL